MYPKGNVRDFNKENNSLQTSSIELGDRFSGLPLIDAFLTPKE